jgi:hypothetical protein
MGAMARNREEAAISFYYTGKERLCISDLFGAPIIAGFFRSVMRKRDLSSYLLLRLKNYCVDWWMGRIRMPAGAEESAALRRGK